MKKLIVIALLLAGSVALAGQTRIFGPEVTAALAALGYVTNTPSFVQYSKSFLFPANGYLNFNTIAGTSGYGVRDSAGTIQFKDSGGSWLAFSTFSGNVRTDANLTAARITIGDDGIHKIKASAVAIDSSGNLTGLGAVTPLKILGTADAGVHTLHITDSTLLTSNRTLDIATGDADRAITLSGNPTLADWFNQSVKSTASPTFNVLTLTSLLTTALTVNSHVITVTGATTLDDWFNQSVKTGASPSFTAATLGALTVNAFAVTVSGAATISQNYSTAGTPQFAGLGLRIAPITAGGDSRWNYLAALTTTHFTSATARTFSTTAFDRWNQYDTTAAGPTSINAASTYPASFGFDIDAGTFNWGIGSSGGASSTALAALASTGLTLVSGAGYTEQGRAFQMGATQSVAYSAGNFTGSGSITWTVASGDQTAFTYVLVGDTMWVNFDITTTTVSGTGTVLLIAVPGGKTIAEPAFLQPCVVEDNTTAAASFGVAFSSSSSKIGISKADFSNWSAATDTTSVSCQLHFKVS